MVYFENDAPATSSDPDVVRFLASVRAQSFSRKARGSSETLADKWRIALELWEEYILKTSPAAG